MNNLEVSLLGSFQIVVNNRIHTKFESDKGRALLAYLILEAHTSHRREALAALLWPDKPKSAARNSLRQTLYRLRKTIGDQEQSPPYFLITPKEIQFNSNSDCGLDVVLFDQILATCHAHHPQFQELCANCTESLTQAMNIYRGDLLAGFNLDNCPQFDWWVLAKREHYHRLARESLQNLTRCFEAQGDYDQVAHFAQRQIELEPWFESAHRSKMRALALAGEKTAALRQYEQCQQILMEEMGIQPTLETRTLAQNIRQNTLHTTAPTLVTPPLPPPPPSSHSLQSEISPFVGREGELDKLAQILQTAQGGQGQIHFIKGEAGSGKTMLLAEFVQQTITRHPDHLVIWGTCDASAGQPSPYLPFFEAFQMLIGDVQTWHAGGFLSSEGIHRLQNARHLVFHHLVETYQDLLTQFIPRQYLRRIIHQNDALPAPLCEQIKKLLISSAPPVEEGDPSHTQPSINQTLILDQITQFLQMITAYHPLLLILEDLHWVDTSSVDLLHHLVKRMPKSRLLIIGTYRPEEVHLSQAVSRHPLSKTLNEIRRQRGDVIIDLAEANGRQFIDLFIDREQNIISRAFRDKMYHLTEGHPLFTVDLLRDMQASGDLFQNQHGKWEQNPNLNWNQIPNRVEGVIVEQINKIPTSLYNLMGAASIQGETFDIQVVAYVLRMDIPDVIDIINGSLSRQHQLIRLPRTPIDHQKQKKKTWRYRFNHILYQKYIYQNLHQSERTHLHQLTGDAIESIYGNGDPAKSESVIEPSQLAWHFKEAGHYEKAIQYLLQAGRAAYRLSANDDAINYLDRALQIIQDFPPEKHKYQLELDILLAISGPIGVKKGLTGEERGEIFIRISELTHKVGNEEQVAKALFGQWSYYVFRNEFTRSYPICQYLFDIGSDSKNLGIRAIAHDAMGLTQANLGNFSAANNHFLQALNGDDFVDHAPNLLGFDSWVTRQGTLSAMEWILGYPDQAYQRAYDMMAWAKNLVPAQSLGQSLAMAVVIELFRKDSDFDHTYFQELEYLRQENHLPLIQFWWLYTEGWKYVNDGTYAQAITSFRNCLSVMDKIGLSLNRTHLRALLAKAYVFNGQIEQGFLIINDILTFIEYSGEGFWHAIVKSIHGEIFVRSGDEANGEVCFEEAIRIAQGQQAKSWELQATLSLCRLWQKQGRYVDAHQQLRLIYDWFTEGFDTQDVKEAKSLLAELVSQL